MASLKIYFPISLLFALLFFLCPDVSLAQRQRRAGAELTPTLPAYVPQQSVNDTVPFVNKNDSIPLDTLAVQPTDSTEVVVVEKKKQPLDAPVIYEASDSIVFTNDGYAKLYGSAKVNYEKIELTSEIISMNMDSSTVYAYGIEDSVGTIKGKPVFKDGDDSYETKTIRYNFKSKRGLISNIVTQQGEGYVIGYNAKKAANNDIFLLNGRYTTCDHFEHPHYYFQMTRAKVRPKKNVVTGPAYLVVEDVPLPIAVPFFFFPFTDSYSSGIIMPTYMDDNTRGFGLTNGGYYFAISDFVDLKVIGEIFTKGSWALGMESNYNRRYKYSGNFTFNYQVTKTGDKNMPDFVESKDMKVTWTHKQDAKASPNSTFSASVNYSSSSYETKNVSNLYTPTSLTQNTKTSSVNYSRSFPDQNLTISGSANIAQTLKDSSISMTLPDLNISLSRLYPFKRKKAVGSERWYEKISVTYTGRLTNSIVTKDDELFDKNPLTDWTNGMNHTVPISATFSLFEHFNLTPSINYTERWYTRKFIQEYDEVADELVTDTINGFYRVWNYSTSLGLNTKLYGMYQPLFAKSKEIQIRHVFTPTLSVSYTPDFGADRYGYYKTLEYTTASGDERSLTYSPYSGNPFGVPGRGKTSSMSLDIANNFEMKIKSDKDSTGYKKISLIDEIGANISYNFAADSMQWSNLGFRLRLKLTKNYTLNMNTNFATYAYAFDNNGNVYTSKRTEWSYGRFGRFQGWSSSFSYSMNNDTFKKLFGKKEDTPDPNKDKPQDGLPNPEGDEEVNPLNEKRVEHAQVSDDGYQKFSMPWTLNFNYSFQIREDTSKPINEKTMRYPYKWTHNIGLTGNIKLSNNWSVSMVSGYDFDAKKITQTTFNISRDLHCFNISASLSPFGTWKSYNFTIRASASILQDLKYEQRSNTSSNVQWY